MGDSNFCSCAPSPPSTTNFTLESNDISSLLLHALIDDSSVPSTSSSSSMPLDISQQHQQPLPLPPSSQSPGNHLQFSGSALFSGSTGFDSSNLTYPGAYYAYRAGNRFPDAMVSSMERIGEFDCESEKDHDASEPPMNMASVRSSCKRSRAAEVHNLSEKRRRQRINEKMKALQKLIPNSNKTDKASMLDEAIEYLKQLQLQVQAIKEVEYFVCLKVLAMRNVSTLHPFYLSGMVPSVQPSQVAARFDEGNRLPGMSRGGGFLTTNQDLPFQTLADLSNHCALLPNVPESINSLPSLGVEPSTSIHHISISKPTKEPCKDIISPQLQLEVSRGVSLSPDVSS
ncbi:hypothetical protein Ancab_028867 [Ancistrocladus abbreviatus]